MLSKISLGLCSLAQKTFGKLRQGHVCGISHLRVGCLYITLQSFVKMTTQRIALHCKPDLRKVVFDPRLNLLGSSTMRLEDLPATYSWHRHICGSESLNPSFSPFWALYKGYTKNLYPSVATPCLLGPVEESSLGYEEMPWRVHGLSQVSHDLFDKNLHTVVCVKLSLAFRALTMFAKHAFIGGKNKELYIWTGFICSVIVDRLEAGFYIVPPFLFCPESNFFSDLKLHFKALQMHHINKMSHYLIPSDTNVSRHLMKAGEGGKAKLWKNSPKHNTGSPRSDLEWEKGVVPSLFVQNWSLQQLVCLYSRKKGWYGVCFFLISCLNQILGSLGQGPKDFRTAIVGALPKALLS